MIGWLLRRIYGRNILLLQISDGSMKVMSRLMQKTGCYSQEELIARGITLYDFMISQAIDNGTIFSGVKTDGGKIIFDISNCFQKEAQ